MRKRDKLYLRATRGHIGMAAIVADNSFIHIPGEKDTSCWGVFDLINKAVVIVGWPVKKKFKMKAHRAHPQTKEFVMVSYGETKFMVLNCFMQVGDQMAPITKWQGVRDLGNAMAG